MKTIAFTLREIKEEGQIGTWKVIYPGTDSVSFIVFDGETITIDESGDILNEDEYDLADSDCDYYEYFCSL